MSSRMRTMLRWPLSMFMVVAGANHFVAPATYVGMMPSVLPAPAALVYIWGVAEILGGLGLILPATRRLAGWGLIALFVAIFPANINMAVHHLRLGGREVSTWALWARLPLQAVLVVWAYWAASERRPRSCRRCADDSDGESRRKPGSLPSGTSDLYRGDGARGEGGGGFLPPRGCSAPGFSTPC